jgi:hypothetical protein
MNMSGESERIFEDAVAACLEATKKITENLGHYNRCLGQDWN